MFFFLLLFLQVTALQGKEPGFSRSHSNTAARPQISHFPKRNLQKSIRWEGIHSDKPSELFFFFFSLSFSFFLLLFPKYKSGPLRCLMSLTAKTPSHSCQPPLRRRETDRTLPAECNSLKPPMSHVPHCSCIENHRAPGRDGVLS